MLLARGLNPWWVMQLIYKLIYQYPILKLELEYSLAKMKRSRFL